MNRDTIEAIIESKDEEIEQLKEKVMDLEVGRKKMESFIFGQTVRIKELEAELNTLKIAKVESDNKYHNALDGWRHDKERLEAEVERLRGEVGKGNDNDMRLARKVISLEDEVERLREAKNVNVFEIADRVIDEAYPGWSKIPNRGILRGCISKELYKLIEG